MKRAILLLFSLSLLIPFYASAENLKCDLDLNLIPDSESSEHKQLSFEMNSQNELDHSRNGECYLSLKPTPFFSSQLKSIVTD